MSTHKAALDKAREVLTRSILQHEPELAGRIHAFDTELLELLRNLGQQVMEDVATELAMQQEQSQQKMGLVVQQRKRTPFLPFSDG